MESKWSQEADFICCIQRYVSLGGVSNVAWCTCPASSQPADSLVAKVKAHAFSIHRLPASNLLVAVEELVGSREVARNRVEVTFHSGDQAFGSLEVVVVTVLQTFP
jgi:hypothetical protein